MSFPINFNSKDIFIYSLILLFMTSYVYLLFANKEIKNKIYSLTTNPLVRLLFLSFVVGVIYSVVLLEKKMTYKLLLTLVSLTLLLFIVFDFSSAKEIVKFVDNVEDKISDIVLNNNVEKKNENIDEEQYCKF